MMMRIQFARWEIEADVEATAAAYARRGPGAADSCGCQPCRNFAAARAHVFPTRASNLLDSLGVRPILEAEISQTHEIRPGWRHYMGFLHVVGRIVSGEDAWSPVGREGACRFCGEPITPSFSLGFTNRIALIPDCFPKDGLLQVEFTAEVPWVLEEPYCGEWSIDGNRK
jgi:hypothetical protein